MRFEVERLEWDMYSALSKLTQHLREDLGLTDESIQSMYRAAGLFSGSSEGKKRVRVGDTADHQLERALAVLIHEVYDRIQRTRYRMLTNELEYARPPESARSSKRVCRRVIIRSIFDSVDHLPDDYNCGFCDVCVPDLDFRRKSAVVAPKDANLDDIARRLPDVMRTFDPLALTGLVELADQHGAVVGLGARAANQLEHDPSNLSALYLAGALRVRRPGFEEAAVGQLAVGFDEATRTGAGEAAQFLFYDTAKRVQPEEAFSWVARKGGTFDTSDGLEWMQEEARSLFGEDSEQHTRVRTVRRLRDVQAAHAALVAEVLTPLQDLADLLGVTA